MQTLISVFDDGAGARRAVERLLQSGFAREDMHLRQVETEAAAQHDSGDDRGVLDSLGHFFVSLFGADNGAAADTYGSAMRRGQAVLVVDARNDQEAESAAVVLHECGAVDVDDRDSSGGTPSLPGVRVYERSAPSLRDLASQRQLREESLLADRAGQVSKEMKQDREERAYASSMTHVDRDRPK